MYKIYKTFLRFCNNTATFCPNPHSANLPGNSQNWAGTIFSFRSSTGFLEQGFQSPLWWCRISSTHSGTHMLHVWQSMVYIYLQNWVILKANIGNIFQHHGAYGHIRIHIS